MNASTLPCSCRLVLPQLLATAGCSGFEHCWLLGTLVSLPTYQPCRHKHHAAIKTDNMHSYFCSSNWYSNYYINLSTIKSEVHKNNENKPKGKANNAESAPSFLLIFFVSLYSRNFTLITYQIESTFINKAEQSG